MTNIYEEIISYKLAQKIKELRDENSTVEIVEKAANYGYVISKKDEEKTTYNILELDSRLVSREWFSTYKFNSAGDCIIGYEDTNSQNETDETKYIYGAINERGCLVVKPQYDALEFSSESTYISELYNRKGYIDRGTGKEITPPAFEHAFSFHDGLARVATDMTDNELLLYGYVSRDKVLTNPCDKTEYGIYPQFIEAGDFNDGHALVRNDFKERHYIDTEGQKTTGSKMQLRRM